MPDDKKVLKNKEEICLEPEECSIAPDVTTIHKKKKEKISKEDRIDNKLDRWHKKYDSICFSKPLKSSSYYLIDTNNLQCGNHKEMIGRGVLCFDSMDRCDEILKKHNIAFKGFKKMRGSEISRYYEKQWNTLAIKSQLEKKG